MGLSSKIFVSYMSSKILLNGQTPATPIPKVLEILELSLKSNDRQIVWTVKILVAIVEQLFRTLTFTLHFTQVEAFSSVYELEANKPGSNSRSGLAIARMVISAKTPYG
jgi:hypothetical protein